MTGSHVALTFDDGPDPLSTPAFLDLLAQTGRRATFFLVASQAVQHPDLVWTAWAWWEWGATPDTIVTTAQRRLRPSGTLLLHDTGAHAPHGDWRRTHKATRRLLERLAASDVGPLREHVAA